MADQWPKDSNGLTDVCFSTERLDPIAAEASQLSADEWNKLSSGLSITSGKCSAASHKVEQTTGPSSKRNELGVTNWETTKAGKIVSAEIVYYPDEVGKFGSSPLAAWRRVTCHEMGHALGMDHVSDPESCMQTGSARPEPYVPSARDAQALRDMYGAEPAVQAAEEAEVRGEAGSLQTGSPFDLGPLALLPVVALFSAGARRRSEPSLSANTF